MPRFEPVYLQELAHELTKFKRVTIEDLIDDMFLKYPAEPEEVELQEALIREDWDPNNHIENFFQSVKEGVETLLQMEAIRRADMSKISAKYIHNAIQRSGQFKSACFSGKPYHQLKDPK
jgi:hypothetical protein